MKLSDREVERVAEYFERADGPSSPRAPRRAEVLSILKRHGMKLGETFTQTMGRHVTSGKVSHRMSS